MTPPNLLLSSTPAPPVHTCYLAPFVHKSFSWANTVCGDGEEGLQKGRLLLFSASKVGLITSSLHGCFPGGWGTFHYSSHYLVHLLHVSGGIYWTLCISSFGAEQHAEIMDRKYSWLTWSKQVGHSASSPQPAAATSCCRWYHYPSLTLLEKSGSSSHSAPALYKETEVAVRMREQRLFLASVPSHRKSLLSML